MNTDKLFLTSILFFALGILSVFWLIRGTMKTSSMVVAIIIFFALGAAFMRRSFKSRKEELENPPEDDIVKKEDMADSSENK